MAKSSKHRSTYGEVLRFAREYWFVSVLVAPLLMVLAYKDIIFLKLNSEILTDVSKVSSQAGQLLVDGAVNNVTDSFRQQLPIVAGLILAVLLVLSLIKTYKRTLKNLQINHHYVNARQAPTSQVVATSIVVRASVFAVPLLYWCLFLGSWFPSLIRLPVGQITNPHPSGLITSALMVLVVSAGLIHIGVVISRLGFRLSRHW